MLDEKELAQVREYIIKYLPELLRTEPEIATTIEGMLAHQFPRRDEFARLLDEVREFRQETGQRFDELHEFRQETNQRFDELHEFRQEANQRFEQVDQRFEQVDQRLERLENGQLVLRRDVVKLQSGQDYLIRRMEGMEAWIRLIAGQIRNEKGEVAEEVVALGLRFGLGQPDVKAENIRLRQKLVDNEGLVYPIPFETEVDLVADNGELLVFEVKSSGKYREVSDFALKLRLLRAQNPDKRVRGVFIAPVPSDDVRRLCLQYGIELVEAPAPGQLPE